MKKALLLVSLMIISSAVFAGTLSKDSLDLTDLLATWGTFVVAIPTLYELIIQFLPDETPSLAIQIGSWVFGIILAFLGWFLQIGMFADVTIWWHNILIGLGAGLAANGFDRLGIIVMILKKLGIPVREKRDYTLFS